MSAQEKKEYQECVLEEKAEMAATKGRGFDDYHEPEEYGQLQNNAFAKDPTQ